MKQNEIIRLIRFRIRLGYMPDNVDQLLNQRGTIETTAHDLAQFGGAEYHDCLAALKEVYL